jgi:hypothetical protein
MASFRDRDGRAAERRAIARHQGAILTLFDGATRRFLFLVMAVYAAAALVAVLRIPKGAGEAGTGT